MTEILTLPQKQNLESLNLAQTSPEGNQTSENSLSLNSPNLPDLNPGSLQIQIEAFQQLIKLGLQDWQNIWIGN